MLGRILDEEKPDMVVFTGDQLNGQGTTWDSKSVLAKFAVAVIERQIPWAAVFGNHDDEDGALKDEQVKLLQALPYSLVERGPKDVHGVGNYVLKVKSADSLSYKLLCLAATLISIVKQVKNALADSIFPRFGIIFERLS